MHSNAKENCALGLINSNLKGIYANNGVFTLPTLSMPRAQLKIWWDLNTGKFVEGMKNNYYGNKEKETKKRATK